jgi:hypothetical protein
MSDQDLQDGAIRIAAALTVVSALCSMIAKCSPRFLEAVVSRKQV